MFGATANMRLFPPRSWRWGFPRRLAPRIVRPLLTLLPGRRSHIRRILSPRGQGELKRDARPNIAGSR
jgi:hypothetical protein